MIAAIVVVVLLLVVPIVNEVTGLNLPSKRKRAVNNADYDY